MEMGEKMFCVSSMCSPEVYFLGWLMVAFGLRGVELEGWDWTQKGIRVLLSQDVALEI